MRPAMEVNRGCYIFLLRNVPLKGAFLKKGNREKEGWEYGERERRFWDIHGKLWD